MPDNIIDKISKEPSKLSDDDIEWILPEVVEFFEPKFMSLARHAYGPLDNGSDIARRAFKELAVEVIEKGLNAFIFKYQHWRKGRNIQSYLITCLNRLADNVKKDVASQAKVTIPVCPACKSMNSREFLRQESRMLRCHSCTVEQDNIEERIKSSSSSQEKNKLSSELRLRKVFSLHSRKGFRCPGCSRFIPSSYVNHKNVSCPYDSHCDWFGSVEELKKMAHPLGLSSHNHISLNSTIKFDSGKEVERQDSIDSGDINADVHIQVRQQYEKELRVLTSVIDTQLTREKSAPKVKSIKRVLMYEAFKSMLKKNPHEMVSYLARQHSGGELPIQARIFQEFVGIVEDSLPISVNYQGEVVDIYSVKDPRLDLFIGQSEFETTVRPDGVIPNLTKEVYVGGRLMKTAKPCFIGKLIDITAMDVDQSILPAVEFYTFSQIKLSDNIPPGLKVKVKHLRITSHYEMHGLVHLQRIRRRIVDSVYQRLNGERRKVGK